MAAAPGRLVRWALEPLHKLLDGLGHLAVERKGALRERVADGGWPGAEQRLKVGQDHLRFHSKPRNACFCKPLRVLPWVRRIG